MIRGCTLRFFSLFISVTSRAPPLRAYNLPYLFLWATSHAIISVEFLPCGVTTGPQHAFDSADSTQFSFLFCQRSISAQCGHASPAPDRHAPSSSDVAILS